MVSQILLSFQSHQFVVVTNTNTSCWSIFFINSSKLLSYKKKMKKQNSQLFFDYLTWFRRLPRFSLICHHLLLHVPDGPGLSGLVIQSTVVVNVSSSQPQSYPGHEGTLSRVEEHRSGDENIAMEPHLVL